MIGAGAHGNLNLPTGEILRTQQTREPRRYLAARPGELARKSIAAGELPFEFAMNAFRLRAGFESALFTARTGLPLDLLEKALLPLEARGLVCRDTNRWRATDHGFRFLNDILVELLPD